MGRKEKDQARALEALTEKHDPEAHWLIETLKEAKPELANLKVFRTKKCWMVRNGRTNLGRVALSSVTQRNKEEVLTLFWVPSIARVDLWGLKKEDFASLWSAKTATSFILNETATELLRDEKANAYEVAINAAAEWRELCANEAKRLKKLPKSDPKLVERRKRDSEFVYLASCVASLSDKAKHHVAKWRKQGPFAKRGQSPTFKSNQPIPLRNTDWMLRAVKDEKGKTKYEMEFQIRGKVNGKKQPKIVAHAMPVSGSAYAAVKALVDDRYIQRDARIIYDKRRKCWTARIGFIFPAEERSDERTNMMVVRRGVGSFLYCMTLDGKISTLGSGTDIIQKKREIEARRYELKSHQRELGRGARGHGKARRYRGYRALEDQEERFVNSYCEQRVAKLDSIVHQENVGTVFIEDFGTPVPQDVSQSVVSGNEYLLKLLTRFPFAKLKDKIVLKLQRSGVEIKEISAAYNSQTCPVCEHVSAQSFDRRNQIFECVECGRRMSIEYAVGWNMFRKAGVDPSLMKDLLRKANAITQAVKRKKHGQQEETDENGETEASEEIETRSEPDAAE